MIKQRLLNKYYYGRSDWKDGTTQFLEMVSQSVDWSMEILDVGAGQTNKKTRFLSTIGRVTGLDVDPAV